MADWFNVGRLFGSSFRIGQNGSGHLHCLGLRPFRDASPFCLATNTFSPARYDYCRFSFGLGFTFLEMFIIFLVAPVFNLLPRGRGAGGCSADEPRTASAALRLRLLDALVVTFTAVSTRADR